MKCPNCYQEVDDDAIFCQHCGHQVRQSDNVPKINLNAPLPDVTGLGSTLGGKYVARYKHNMGFPFNKKNSTYAYQKVAPADPNQLSKRLQLYYKNEQDDKTPDDSEYILSFEDTGLLVLGVVEFIHLQSYYEHGYEHKDNDYNYHYTLHNCFIPKDKIVKANLTKKNPLQFWFDFETEKYGASFIINRLGKRVKTLKLLVNKLNQ